MNRDDLTKEQKKLFDDVVDAVIAYEDIHYPISEIKEIAGRYYKLVEEGLKRAQDKI